MNPFSAIVCTLVSAVVFALLGSGVGFLLGRFNPEYYRGVFRNGDSPDFDPIAVGIGQGATQGLVGGILVGLIVVGFRTFGRRGDVASSGG